MFTPSTYGVDASTLEIDIRYNDPSTNNDINYFKEEAANDNVKEKDGLKS